MNKKLIKNAASFLILLALFVPLFVFAQVDVQDYFTGAEPGEIALPHQEKPATEIVTSIINVVLGLLGLIAVIIILIGGFKWMTAQGSDDKVTDAKKTITYGLVGLAIVLLAYVIVRMVVGFVIDIGEGNT